MKKKGQSGSFQSQKEKAAKKAPHLALWTIQTSKENSKKTTKIAENNQDEKFYNQTYTII